MIEPEEKQVPFFRFEDLRIYHKSLDYITFVFEKTDRCPNELRTRFIDAADNIAQIITESSSRNKQHCANILKGAKPYVRACVVYTTLAARMGAFTEEETEQSTTHLIEITKMLGAFIASLTKNRNTGNFESRNVNDDAEMDLDNIGTSIDDIM